MRDLPDDLVRRAKAYAALSGLTLKDFVIQALSGEMEKDIQITPAHTALFVSHKRKARRKNK